MPPTKRKRDGETQSTAASANHAGGHPHRDGNMIHRPPAGTRAYTTGQGVKEGLRGGSVQALHQQVLTPHSKLPLPIAHPSVVILQHYLEASPLAEEIFEAWQKGERNKEDRLAEVSIALLAQIITLLTPLPFFRSALLGIVGKLCNNQEGWADSLNRYIQSPKRDETHAALSLLAAAMYVDPPEISVSTGPTGTGGRLGLRVWSIIAEGGGVKALGKTFGMRKRNKEGLAEYGDRDPLDRPDVRHLAIHFVLPLFASPAFHSSAKSIMPNIYNHIASDPAITVYRILTAIWTAITDSTPGISRRISLVLLNESSIENLLGLLNRKEVEPSTGSTIGEMATGFLEGVTTDPGRGLCFADEGWYPRQVEEKENDDEDDGRIRKDDKERQSLHNRILSNVVRRTGARVVDGDGKLGDMTSKILEACPELVAGYWAHSALGLEPRLDARWMATMAYVGRIISLPPPSLDKFRQLAPRESDVTMPLRPTPPAVSVMIESILPSPLNKHHLTKGLQHPDGMVRHMTAVTLARGLQKLEVVQKLLKDIGDEVEKQPSGSTENVWSRARRELEMEARRRVPDVLVVISFAQKAAQLAPAEPETDEEKSLVAKSSLLTESALRLFGLYYRTLPSIAGEAKFDIGRLLVSSSSAKAEKKERQAMKTGSVVDDTGSMASFGTAGTAGMGGGFGQSRGEVEGFEALSQVHVLELLGQVKDWSWANKAAASQYTYLYHILQLHLNTQFSLTRSLTISLLKNLLEPTLLFDHDRSELDIWLSSLLYADPSISGPHLIIQQIHLLSFLDDCFRRAQKASYKYIEDLIALVPDTFSFSRPGEMISCVMMAMLEQLKAKILGQHIATDAAWVVLSYLRRVMLGLSGKIKDKKVIDAITGRLDEILKEAKEAGQDRKGLKAVVKGMKKDGKSVFTGANGASKGGKDKEDKEDAGKDEPMLVDESLWVARSFERAALSASMTADIEALRLAKDLVSHESQASALRQLQFVLHVIPHSTNLAASLEIAKTCLDVISDADLRLRAKSVVFEAEAMEKLYLTDRGDAVRDILKQLVTCLDSKNASDLVLSASYVARCLELVQAGKKADLAQALVLLNPWCAFVSPQEAKSTLSAMTKRIGKIPNPSTEVKDAVGRLLLSTKDASFAVQHMSHLVSLAIIRPLTELVTASSHDIGGATLEADKKAIRQLFELDSGETFELLAALVDASPSATLAIRDQVVEDQTRLSDARMLPVVRSLLDVPAEKRLDEGLDVICATALKALSTTTSGRDDTAIAILTLIGAQDSAVLETSLRDLRLEDYTPGHARLASNLAGADSSSMYPGGALTRLVSVGLEVAVRAFSGDGELSDTTGAMVKDLTSAFQTVVSLEMPLHLVEPVVTAAITDRLDSATAMDLAAVLVNRSVLILKASFIRVHLQQMISSSQFTKLSGPSSAASERLPFVRLIHALFHASTYVSCQANFIEPLVAIYRGTMSLPDRLVLDMFQTFEAVRRISVSSVLSRWSSNGLSGSGRPLDAITSLDASKVTTTCSSFPLRRQLGGAINEQGDVASEAVYDPVFIMALYAATLAEETLSGLDWVEIMRSGSIGIVVCAMSSRDEGIRAIASWLLGKTYRIISETAFMERDQLRYTLRLLRHSIAPPAAPAPSSESDAVVKPTSSKIPRLPTLITLFLSQVIRYQTTPAHFLYPLTSRFLLQRPVLDIRDVPMLYSSLYANGEGWKKERGWIVRFLREGVRSDADWRILKRRHTWDLLATMYHISLDIAFRRLILQAMETFSRVPSAARSLVHRSQMLIWLHTEWTMSTDTPNKAVEEEKATYLRIMENLVTVVVADDLAKRNEISSIGSAAESVQLDAAGEKEKEKGEKEFRVARKGWDLDAERLIRTAAAGADSSRLEILARIFFRISPESVDTRTLITLLAATKKAASNSAIKQETKEMVNRASEHLFEASLRWHPNKWDLLGKLMDPLDEALKDLGGLLAGMESDLGQWVRLEKRLARWA